MTTATTIYSQGCSPTALAELLNAADKTFVAFQQALTSIGSELQALEKLIKNKKIKIDGHIFASNGMDALENFD